MPSDSQRILDIIELVNEGYLEQLLISQDVDGKHFLRKYGGYGYAYVLLAILPIIRKAGLSQDQIDTIIRRNPRRLLSFASYNLRV